MIKIPNLIGDEKADAIVSRFINDRLIRIMEDIILDEVVWKMAERGELDPEAASKSFDELVDISKLIPNMDFAEMVSTDYLPENYPIEQANEAFLGAYKLLKAEEEYVPNKLMEFVLFGIINKEVGEVDLINSDMLSGMFGGIDVEFDGFENFGDDIEDNLIDEDDVEEITTIERLPEADRIIVKNAVLELHKGGHEGEELESFAENSVEKYEDLRAYFDICFIDTDCLQLGEYTEDELKSLELN